MFILPVAKGGYLETVHGIVASVAQGFAPLPHDGKAARLLTDGDALLARGDFRSAYDQYSAAYRAITSPDKS